MADTQSTMAADRTTVEAFIADRQRFWMSFTHFLGYGALGVAVVLILMALFLL